ALQFGLGLGKLRYSGLSRASQFTDGFGVLGQVFLGSFLELVLQEQIASRSGGLNFEPAVLASDFVLFEINASDETFVEQSLCAVERSLGLPCFLLGDLEVIVKLAQFLFGLAIAEGVKVGVFGEINLNRRRGFGGRRGLIR